MYVIILDMLQLDVEEEGFKIIMQKGHLNQAKECKRRLWTPYQKEKTSSRLKIWKKKEVQPERCGIAEYTDMTDSEVAGSVEHQCSKSHTRVS